MVTNLPVFKEVDNSWDANDKRKAGEAWDLLCPERRAEQRGGRGFGWAKRR